LRLSPPSRCHGEAPPLLLVVHADHSTDSAAAAASLVQLLLVGLVVTASVVSLCTSGSGTHAEPW
jgi:hypothetical protein